jgi:N-acetylmuramic acid 6-phosphate etherase
MKNYSTLPTEQPNPASQRLDSFSSERLALLMNREDARVITAVKRVTQDIVNAVRFIVPVLRSGGRLFFIGAGTSGRLGVLEAAECPPTFNTPPKQIQAIMAGGNSSVFRSKEGVEDNALEAQRIVRRKVRRGDVLVGVASSGVTPFVLAGLGSARSRGAKTILVTCNAFVVSKSLADIVIAPEVGPEILTGSTRLKAGTATKLVLNMLTTMSMVQIGKVYGHWMVDLQPRSQKLKARAVRLIQKLAGSAEPDAMRYLQKANNHVKRAIVMARKNLSFSAAQKLLKKRHGFLKQII